MFKPWYNFKNYEARRWPMKNAAQIAKKFKALGHETRVEIIAVLAESPAYVLKIAEKIKTPQSNVSQHLKELEYAGFVEKEREFQKREPPLKDQKD
jgi:DNA-binding transcriptional ArsR family regulator